METASTALSLAWAPITCVVHGHSAGVEFVILYELQMQQVCLPVQQLVQQLVERQWCLDDPPHELRLGSTHPRLHSATLQVDNKKALHPDRWSVQYVGAASFVHVKGLMPGTQYCCRVIAVPSVTNGNAEVSTSLPSETTLVETLPCPPKGQPMPQLASRLKKELKVGVALGLSPCAGRLPGLSCKLCALGCHLCSSSGLSQRRREAGRSSTGCRSTGAVAGQQLDCGLHTRCCAWAGNCRAVAPQMSPAPDGWHGQPEAEFCTVHLGPERVYLARRLLPGQRYRVRVKAINCEVGKGSRRLSDAAAVALSRQVADCCSS